MWDLLRDVLCMEHTIRDVLLYNGFAIFVILGVLFFFLLLFLLTAFFPL